MPVENEKLQFWFFYGGISTFLSLPFLLYVFEYLFYLIFDNTDIIIKREIVGVFTLIFLFI